MWCEGGILWECGGAARQSIKSMFKPKKLGMVHTQSEGVKRNIGEAAWWFRKVANQGHGEAKKHVLKVKGFLRKQRQAATSSRASSSHIYANCGFVEGAGSVALKPCSRCNAVVY